MKLSKIRESILLTLDNSSPENSENQTLFNLITNILIDKNNSDPDITLEVYRDCVAQYNANVSQYLQSSIHKNVFKLLKDENQLSESKISEAKHEIRPPATPSLQSCTDKLDIWLLEEEKNTYQAMIQARESLKTALIKHGVKPPHEKSLSEIIKLLTNPLLIPNINSTSDPSDLIINGPLNRITQNRTPLELTQSLEEMTADQYNKKPAKWLLVKAFTKVFKNKREKIKSHLLSTSGIQDNLDPFIDAYQMAQINYIALHRGYQNANEIISAHCRAQERSPEYYFDTYVLKRHDESNNMHKGFGSNRDTQLTSIGAPIISGQTIFDLTGSKVVHSTCARGLKASGLIDHIRLHVSPVKRSYQTAVLSTFDSDIPDETVVSGKYTEIRSNNLAKSSTTRDEASARPKLEKAFKGFKNFTVDEHSFTKAKLNVQAQNHRIEDAAKKFIEEDLQEEHRGSTLNFLVAHGGMNRAMLDVHTNKIAGVQNFVCTVPENIHDTKLDYGEYYTLLVARDRNTNKIVGSYYQGQFTRYGILSSGENTLTYGPEESTSIFSAPNVMFHFKPPIEDQNKTSDNKVANSPGKEK